VEKNTTHFKSNTMGFYAIQGVSVPALLADSQEDALVAFLHQVKAATATAKAIVIVLDNDSSHPAVTVTETAQELGIYWA
jgi:hypothetical protein